MFRTSLVHCYNMIDLSDDNGYTFCNIAITWSIKNVIKHVFANKYIKYQLEITNNVMLDNVGIYVINLHSE